MTTTEWVQVEELAKVLCAAFSKDRGFTWGDSHDFAWENVGEGARGSWRVVARAAMSYLREHPDV